MEIGSDVALPELAHSADRQAAEARERRAAGVMLRRPCQRDVGLGISVAPSEPPSCYSSHSSCDDAKPLRVAEKLRGHHPHRFRAPSSATGLIRYLLNLSVSNNNVSLDWIPGAAALCLYIAGCAGATAAPPPGAEHSPDHAWWEGAKTPECYGCCSVADGRQVRARPDPDSPMGWDVLFNDNWVPVPAGTRAVRCDDDNTRPVENYPPHPAGSAVIWEYPSGVIRCWVPPEGSG